MKWTRKHKERADEYVEMIFDDIMDKSTNAAFWIHANPEGDACFFIARDDLPRRRLFIDALVEAMDSDDELLQDIATATAIVVHRITDERGGLSWDQLFDDET